MGTCGIRTSVTYLTVGLGQELETMARRDDDLVVSMSILPPEVVGMYKETERVCDETTPFGFDDALWSCSGL